MLIDMAGILFLFLRSQTVIAGMWREARGAQTRVLGEFSQDVAACMDIRGGRKEEYARERLEKEFRALAQSYEKASFWGNLPSTVFYSLLNVAEGAVFAAWSILFTKGGNHARNGLSDSELCGTAEYAFCHPERGVFQDARCDRRA